MKKTLFLLAALFCCLSIVSSGVNPALGADKQQVLRLATTTSTADSGLLDYLLPKFQKKYGIRVDVISLGTGKAIALGETGDVDVVLVHARELEDKFVADGHGVNRRDVMYNDFVLAGPQDDPAGVRSSKKAVDAFKKISDAQSKFISRGDKSGTDIKEKEIWKKAGIAPSGAWYIEAGQGMGATLTMANELGAYTLTDTATFISYKDKTNLKELLSGDPALFNPYGVIAVNPKKHPYVKYDLAMKFIKWLTSTDGQKLIATYKAGGRQLFYPDAGKKKK